MAYAQSGISEYQKRLSRYSKCSIQYLKKTTSDKESAALLKASEGTFRVSLDERGECLKTTDIHKRFTQWQLNGVSRISILIGGADGHHSELRKESDWLWALSPMTLQHELALLVLLEQLYRVETISTGTPYHRE